MNVQHSTFELVGDDYLFMRYLPDQQSVFVEIERDHHPPVQTATDFGAELI